MSAYSKRLNPATYIPTYTKITWKKTSLFYGGNTQQGVYPYSENKLSSPERFAVLCRRLAMTFNWHYKNSDLWLAKLMQTTDFTLHKETFKEGIHKSMISRSLSPWHGASSGCGWSNGLRIWRVAANTLNKQSRTADRGWSSSLGVGRGANNSSP
jgi:hypothetical protein